MKPNLRVLLFLGSTLVLAQACIHPKVGIQKSRLLDPTMDPAAPAGFGESISGGVQGNFEKAVIGGGGAAGGSCPTCK